MPAESFKLEPSHGLWISQDLQTSHFGVDPTDI